MAHEGIERAVRDLVSLGEAFPPDVAPRFEPPASQAELADLETAVGGALPAEMKALLETARAIVAMDIHNGYLIGGPVELARSVRRRDFPREIDAGGQRVSAIPLATDGGGNAFMLTAPGSVWRRNRETGICTLVAGAVEEFLRRVALDWSHDLEGDRTWTYLV